MTREYTIFKNKGEMDPRSIKTFGVNVKEGENPFGYFGTGLKYAIGIILRSGCEITIYCGLEKFEFALKPTKIRGKDFSIVTMNGEELGFTTEIGKAWELWMAYRELYCNTLDESGDVYVGKDIIPESDVTYILVSGESFANIHYNKRDFILQGDPLEVHEKVEIHGRPSKGFFHKRIFVGSSGKNCLLTYDIIKGVSLTEDRTLKGVFDAEWEIVGVIKKSKNSSLIEKVVTAGDAYFEGDLHFTYNLGKPSDEFLDVVARLTKEGHPNLNLSATEVVKKYAKEEEVTIHKLTTVQAIQLEKAKSFSSSLDLFKDGEFPILIVETLGKNILGRVKGWTIYLAVEAFEMGTKMVAITLIEEYIHLKHGHGDMTRGMQNLLFNKIITLGELLNGEPL